jgi:hypothetical protein
MDLGSFFSFLIYTQSIGLLGRGISQSLGGYLHTGQHKHRINAHNADIHASSAIRTHDPSARVGEDGSCLRPRGHCDRYSSPSSAEIKNASVYTSTPRIKASCLITHKNKLTVYLWPTCEWALPMNPGSQNFSICSSPPGNKWSLSLSHYPLYFLSSPSLWYLTVLYTLSSPHFTSLRWVSYSLHFTKQECLLREKKPLRESTMKQIMITCRRTGRRRRDSVYLLPSPMAARS